jgi:hypothetical protein
MDFGGLPYPSCVYKKNINFLQTGLEKVSSNPITKLSCVFKTCASHFFFFIKKKKKKLLEEATINYKSCPSNKIFLLTSLSLSLSLSLSHGVNFSLENNEKCVWSIHLLPLRLNRIFTYHLICRKSFSSI